MVHLVHPILNINFHDLNHISMTPTLFWWKHIQNVESPELNPFMPERAHVVLHCTLPSTKPISFCRYDLQNHTTCFKPGQTKPQRRNRTTLEECKETFFGGGGTSILLAILTTTEQLSINLSHSSIRMPKSVNLVQSGILLSFSS